ncbi:hypothetical protein SAMN05518801_101587 [Novosphingobium sp. CF614]|uniref:hypothetical protein n=1 Tax=Novosphingobium sp. CF614 TaxID=1884364 RepID=UPI0008EAFA94|nr:hypothetical protein [Novosphingobium sp. CF614]SFF79682.1 hypothetical protein SAMN05518801_101587 [Novosphingobium sp. CF614]
MAPRANHPTVTIAGGQIANAAAASDAASEATGDWEAVRRASDIQFSPLPPPKAPEVPQQVPEWLKALGRALEAIFAPLGRLLGVSWPVFQWVLIALAVLLVLFLLWRLAGPMLENRRKGDEGDAPGRWAPSRIEAMALLEDADRLAGEGRFGEAAHLLLRRSIGHIADARPDWLIPASTAREIAVLPMLPEAGRRAFATIAERVERCRFALRDLDAADWSAARAAYADFARIELSA